LNESRPANSPDPPRPESIPTAGASNVPSAASFESVDTGTGGSARSSMLTTGVREREQFSAEELAIVLSHYDLGIVEAVKEYPRGSRRAPKLLLRSENGTYLLKRRARGKDDAFKVAFTHGIQIHLANHQFPLPHLIGTRRDNNSMLQWRGEIYELFEYIKGTGYDGSLEGTQDAGKTLGLFHRLLTDFHSAYDPPRGNYHNARTVREALERCPKTLQQSAGEGRADPESATDITRRLKERYARAAADVEQSGLPDWPQQITHSDWHPGNMLFRGARVVAVIDYDAARLCQRVIDIANGALQFSIVGGGDDAGQWPDYLDLGRFKRFLLGYDRVNQLSRAELRIIPDLMAEALIAEAAIPVAQTGSFARIDGLAFLNMIGRKIDWLESNREQLVHILED